MKKSKVKQKQSEVTAEIIINSKGKGVEIK